MTPLAASFSMLPLTDTMQQFFGASRSLSPIVE
jgi:hypothetical protein